MTYLSDRLHQKQFGKPDKQKKVYKLNRKPIKKKLYRIKKISEKRKKENEVYIPVSHEIRENKKLCEIKSPDCTKFTQGVHHVEGRVGKDYTDKSKMKAACNACNLYIETHSAWAKKNGFKKANYNSKLTGVKKIK